MVQPKSINAFVVLQIDDMPIGETGVCKDTVTPVWEHDMGTLLHRNQMLEILVMHKVCAGGGRGLWLRF